MGEVDSDEERVGEDVVEDPAGAEAVDDELVVLVLLEPVEVFWA